MAIYTGKSYYDPEQDAIVQGTSGSNPNKNFNYLNFYSAPQTVNPAVPEPTATLTPTSTQKKPASPGRAWVWDEASGSWKQPEKPTDGEYQWYDNLGWKKVGGSQDTSGTAGGFDQLIPKSNNGSPFSYSDYMDDGWLVAHYADGSTKYIIQDPSKSKTTGGGKGAYTATDGTKFTDQAAYANYQNMLNNQKAAAETAYNNRVSAYQLLQDEFSKYGLGGLVEDVKKLAADGLPAAEFAIKLRNLPAYQDRFAANRVRTANGLRALSEAEYLALEDQYQNVMRKYGLPQSFYTTGTAGKQPELEKFIAGDVSPVELEDRVQSAVNRVQNANPEVMQALQNFYPGITKANLLAYTLDPNKALPLIQRQITAAEIGGAAMQAGLETSAMNAEALAAQGVNKAQAQQGYQTIGGFLPRASTLADIYKQTPYTQTTAEAEVFGTSGAVAAEKQRKKLTQLEQASFGGAAGTSQGALERNRSGAF